MPKCLVRSCHHATGRRDLYPEITFHQFPQNVSLCKRWLKNAGMEDYMMEEYTRMIMEDKTGGKFRMCSAHFLEDCFVMKGSRRFLKPNAAPTVFQKETIFMELTKEPWKRRIIKKARTDVAGTSLQSSPAIFCYCKCHRYSLGEEKTTVSIGTQTEPIELVSMVVEEPYIKLAKKMNISNDHAYAKQGETLFPEIHHSVPIKVQHHKALSDISLSVVEESGTQQQTAYNVPRQNQLIEERKFIVFESCLDILLSKLHCPEKECFSPIQKICKHVLGSHLIVYSLCQRKHHCKLWESQPYLKSLPAGNVLLAAAIVLSGSSFTKVKEIVDYAGVQFFSETTFQSYQTRFIFPGIDHTWLTQKKQIKKELGQKPLFLAGDGQRHSPGFSTKYCTYTFMDIITEKIVDFEVVQVTQCTSPVAMEKHAFAISLQRILEEDYNIHVIGTDCHPGIRKMMTTHPFKNINHQFDLWYYVKGLKKKLLQLARKSNCSSLVAWIGPILNHFFWCSHTCCGSPEYFKERWESLLHHITNVHHWEEQGHEYHCSHGEIGSENPVVPWLQRNSASFEVLSNFIKNPQIKKDIPHLIYFCQTGVLEAYHSMMLKFRQKHTHYTFDSIETRTKLAAIVHNNNVGRNLATVQRSREVCQRIGTEKKLEFPRGRKKWVVRTVYERINNDHVIPMMSNMMDIIEGTISSRWVSKNKPILRNTAPVKRPPKEQAIEEHRTRFTTCEITNPSSFEYRL